MFTAVLLTKSTPCDKIWGPTTTEFGNTFLHCLAGSTSNRAGKEVVDFSQIIALMTSRFLSSQQLISGVGNSSGSKLWTFSWDIHTTYHTTRNINGINTSPHCQAQTTKTVDNHAMQIMSSSLYRLIATKWLNYNCFNCNNRLKLQCRRVEVSLSTNQMDASKFQPAHTLQSRRRWTPSPARNDVSLGTFPSFLFCAVRNAGTLRENWEFFKKSLDLELQWLVCSLEGRPPREKFVDGLTEPNRSIFSDICPSGWKCFNKKYNSAHATNEENNQDACPPQHECSPWPCERRCSASWYDRTNKQEPTFWNLGIAGTRWNELQILFEESIRLTLNKLEKSQVGYGWHFWWPLGGGWTAWFS